MVAPDLVIQDLTLNQTVSNTISRPGENDTYTFNGVAGQQLYFDALNTNNPNFTVRLFTPSGRQLYSGAVQNDRATNTTSDYYNVYPGLILTETGTYRLVIDGNGDATGNYSFRLLNEADASAVTFDSNITGSFGSNKRETNIYRINGTANQRIYIDNINGSYNDYWYLYSPSGQIVTYDRTSVDRELVLPANGEYILTMQGSGVGNENYTFRVVAPELVTQDLTLNQTVSDTISKPGETDSYIFTGVAGQKLFFDALAGNTSIRGKLFSPTGVEILNNPTNSDWNPFTLTETGIYRFIIDGNGDTTGDYSFRLWDIVTTNTIEMGTAIFGNLNPGNEVELYHFTGSAGQKLSFDLAASSWTNADWVLYGLNNQVIAAPYGWSPDFNIMLPASGLYTLAIRGNSADTVNYSFTVNDTTPLPVATTGLGTVQSGTISAGQVITQTFTAKAGVRIYFDSQLANNAPLQLIVINPDGTNVFATTTSTDIGPIQLQQTGTYTWKIQGTSTSATGNYQFAIIDLPTETPAIRGDRRVLQFSAEVTKPLEPGRLMHEYSFTGKAGQRLYYDGMFTDGASFGTDAVTARLFSPSGNVIFNPGYWEGYSTANVGPFTLTETGTYTLLLGGEKDTPTGYRFRLWDLADAHELELNKKVKENLLRGNDTNLYKFTGSTGQRLYFDAISGSNANWTLYRPGNQEVLANNNINTDFEVVLPTDGEYILAVSGYSNTPTQYGFQVFGSKSHKVSIITPGDGESNNSIGEDLGVYQVRLNVDDGHGGSAEQNFQVRVLPELDNHVPSIITQAVTTGFDGKRYTYDVDANDADGDTLTYRLMDAPKAMFIDDVTGMIIWASPD